MKNLRYTLRLLLPPALALLFVLFNPFALPAEVCKTLGVMAWMLAWWLMESVPMPVTALLPIVLFPLLGITSMEETCKPYGDKFIFLFLGGFILALALEKTALHRRFSLNLVLRTGTRPNQIILGFMLSAYIISMWISNTATTLMMFPIALAVSELFNIGQESHPRPAQNFRILLFLGIAYASSIGGMATLIGTPPNAAAAGILSETFKRPVGFAEFMTYGLPFSLILLLLSYFVLTRWIFPTHFETQHKSADFIHQSLRELGPTDRSSRVVLWVFALAILLWLSEGSIRQIWPSSQISDVWIAMAAGISLFLLPGNNDKPVLEWPDTQRLPWGILLMFGGGLALAQAFKTSGTLQMLIEALQGLQHIPLASFMIILSAVGILLTAFMSNLAMVTLFVPVVAMLAQERDVDPLLFALPVTLSASCDFMFPMSTPPNAIAFSSGYIKSTHMLRAGLVLNLLSFLLLMGLIAVSLGL